MSLALIRQAAELVAKSEPRKSARLPSIKGGKLRSRKQEVPEPVKEENAIKVLETVEILRALAATLPAAREMAEAIHFVEEEE